MSLELEEGGGRTKSRSVQQKLMGENTVTLSRNSPEHPIKSAFMLLAFCCKINFRDK